MAEGDKLSIGAIRTLPKFLNEEGKDILANDLKRGDILLVVEKSLKRLVVRFDQFEQCPTSYWVLWARDINGHEICVGRNEVEYIQILSRDLKGILFPFIEGLAKEKEQLSEHLARIKKKMSALLE